MRKLDLKELWNLLKFGAILTTVRIIQQKFFTNSWSAPVVEFIHEITFIIIACLSFLNACMSSFQPVKEALYLLRIRERRTAGRDSCDYTVFLKNHKKKIEARVVNVSTQGICIRTTSPIGSELINLDNSSFFSCEKAYVRWSRRLSGGLYETGLLFAKI